MTQTTPENNNAKVHDVATKKVGEDVAHLESNLSAEELEQRSRQWQVQTQISTSPTVSSISVVEETTVEKANPSMISASSKDYNQSAQPCSSGQNVSNNFDKNPLQLFNDYVAALFQKAEVYEAELERRESKTDLQTSLDDVRHGSTTLHYNGSHIQLVNHEKNVALDRQNSECIHDISSLKLSPTTEAIAAVDALSNFRPLSEVRREISSRSGTNEVPHDITSNVFDEMTHDDEDAKQKWEKFCDTKRRQAFGDVAIEGISLSLTVDELYDLVFKDNAFYSIGKFMMDNGDFEVETTSWEPTNGHPMTRTIHYTHPVNVPMAPPTAKAFKTQYLHKFGIHGLCLESSTIVEDVPMTDCFVVDDRLWVCQDKVNGGSIVKVTFQIRFIKTTMFRRIIENATRIEFENWWNQFGEMILKLQGPVASDDEDFELVVKELEEIIQVFEDKYVGKDLPLLDALQKIRSSSMKLSMIARQLSIKRNNDAVSRASDVHPTDITTNSHLSMVSIFQSFVSYVQSKKLSDNAALGISIILFVTGILNLFICQKLLMTNQILSHLDANLKQLTLANGILLSRLDQTVSCAA